MWQPNASATTDTTSVFQAMQQHWPGLKSLEIVRLQSGRDPRASLGVYVREENDNPRGIVDNIAEICSANADQLTGEQRYEIVAFVMKKGRRQGEEKEESFVLGRLKFGTGSSGDAAVGGLVKEVTQLVKGLGDSQERIAEADHKRMQTLSAGFDLQARMMTSMAEGMEKGASMNAHAVRALELTLADGREQREAAEAREFQRAQFESEERQHDKTLTLLRDIGAHAMPLLSVLAPALAYKMKVDAATKAKEHGVNVEPPPDPPPPQPPKPAPQKAKIEQVTVGHIAERFFRDHGAHTDELRAIAGDDIIDLLLALSKIPGDNEQFAICVKLKAIVDKLGKKAVTMLTKAQGLLGVQGAHDLQQLLLQISEEVTPRVA